MYLDNYTNSLIKLCQQNRVKSLYVFGSVLTERFNEQSDIDLAITSDKKDFFLRDDLREHLQNHFKVPVDIGYFDSFREFYKQKIAQEILYA